MNRPKKNYVIYSVKTNKNEMNIDKEDYYFIIGALRHAKRLCRANYDKSIYPKNVIFCENAEKKFNELIIRLGGI